MSGVNEISSGAKRRTFRVARGPEGEIEVGGSDE